MIENKKLKKIIDTTPAKPGIYKMYNEEKEIIYIGKAKNLKKRIRQYFQKNYEHSTRTKKLLEKMKNIEVIEVTTELEAIILESNLIKEFKPKYNILLKDDKNYVYIKITNETFPIVKIVRQLERDGAKYYGPKTAGHKVKETLKFLKKLFPYRHCNIKIEVDKNREPTKTEKIAVKTKEQTIKIPCLDYHIKRCIAPCIGNCTVKEYDKVIENVKNFLEGNTEKVIKELMKEMQNYAEKKEFEKAGKTRDKIKRIEDIMERQKVSSVKNENTDIINYCTLQDRAYFNLFQVRNGKLIGQENFILNANGIEKDNTSKEVLKNFLKQYYKITTNIPKEVIIPHTIEEIADIEKIINGTEKNKVKIKIPKKGEKMKLLKMSGQNARIYADKNRPSWQEESKTTKEDAKKLQKILNLKSELKRIECYDISHLNGTNTVASMVVFKNGAPKKDHYRKFRIKTVDKKPDDYKSMEEVLTRRLSKISLKHQQLDFKFKKATKKILKEIGEEEKTKKKKQNKTEKTFYILEKDKKIIGTIAINKHKNKITELTNLWIDTDFRGNALGYKLIKKAINKIKERRIYIICKDTMHDYYAKLGFEDIKKIPKELEKRKKQVEKIYKKTTKMVFDKNKHKEDVSFNEIPDLLVIDGGKGQLRSAIKVLKTLNLKIPTISLAKRMEEIFTKDSKTPIILEKTNNALKLLQRLRDEAHRFAITYNKNLRQKKFKKRKN